MAHINENYLKLQGNYLFSEIARKVREYEKQHKETEIISLGIGDVTQPIAPVIIEALHKAVDEMGAAESFHGYAPDMGYEFLRAVIAKEDFQKRGINISEDEIFVSDGAKSDCSNIQEIFGVNNVVAVCDPVYPVYVDSNVMAGRAGDYDPAKGLYTKVIYMPCTAENGFVPDIPDTSGFPGIPDVSGIPTGKSKPDLIYLCYPNNPTGAAISKESLQKWVDYAVHTGAIILYDAAYEAYITDDSIPHSIYECEGAKECAIEIRSFSKNAGFTGLRLGFTVVPKELKCGEVYVHPLWARRHGTKYNGAPYIVQRAGEAVYSEEGKAQISQQIRTYMRNAGYIKSELVKMGYTVYGGENAPYLWMMTPNGMSSWEFFDLLLDKARVVGTPGSGFGPKGEGYFRFTAFATYDNCVRAMERMKTL